MVLAGLLVAAMTWVVLQQRIPVRTASRVEESASLSVSR